MEPHHTLAHNYGSGSHSTPPRYYTEKHHDAAHTPPTNPLHQAPPPHQMPTPLGSPRMPNPNPNPQPKRPHPSRPHHSNPRSSRRANYQGPLEVREPSIQASTPDIPPAHHTHSREATLPRWFASRVRDATPSAADKAHASMMEKYAGSSAQVGVQGTAPWQRFETRRVETTTERVWQREFVRVRHEQRTWVRRGQEKKGKGKGTRRQGSNGVEWKEEQKERRETWIRCL
ncbi:uncharacterized protein EKO05_0010295 [Ascochyta rabiei]|uniref:Uncharacterized protein n=1 Tax=Didymella rabiei TaxID=5454 RepID=A0A163F262_DIDRA|nr:uncharacterized protein EKO05_0010295 [Ascochyta rabiei]KZM24093.1 hypothetical protein ST47_g4781 [Ascochyta rabiei]UPX20049.1 hypothetical protein EKO05_0010295 [Ascochyta rabiei]